MKNKHSLIRVSSSRNLENLVFFLRLFQTNPLRCAHHHDAFLPREVSQSILTTKSSFLSYSRPCNYVSGIQEASEGNYFPFGPNGLISIQFTSGSRSISFVQSCWRMREKTWFLQILRTTIFIAHFKYGESAPFESLFYQL